MGVGSAGVVEAGDIGHQALLELLDGPVGDDRSGQISGKEGSGRCQHPLCLPPLLAA